jgi:hypothetical protein
MKGIERKGQTKEEYDRTKKVSKKEQKNSPKIGHCWNFQQHKKL